MNSIWLVDADNQSAALAETTANILGWPDRVVLAGLPANVKSWQEKASFPEGLQIETWDSPAIPDGADVLLAMAAGCLVDTMARAVIFSRDGLVAGTLGQILHARGIRVLAVSAKDHPGLPYPHLTLPLNGRVAQVASAPALPAEGPTEEYANEVFTSIFRAMGNPVTINRASFFHQLNQRGFAADIRNQLQRLATDYVELGTGVKRAVVHRSKQALAREPGGFHA